MRKKRVIVWVRLALLIPSEKRACRSETITTSKRNTD
jgi:hypothetical protein